jgi:hypothetical protein
LIDFCGQEEEVFNNRKRNELHEKEIERDMKGQREREHRDIRE